MSAGESAAVLELRGGSIRYPGAAADAVHRVNLAVRRGTMVAILGPNGSGKSTLLRGLLGTVPLQEGEVFHDGLPLHRYSRRELALRIGVVAQLEEVPFPVRVRDLVAMGRYPHLGPWRAEGARDREAVASALERCGAAEFADRPFDTLSGGERQRVRIARALAQEPSTLVLDEPTSALDVHYEMAIFELLSALTRECGVTVVLVTHHLNLAARFADDLLLLHRGEQAAHGSPVEVLRRDVLERVYDWPIAVTPHPGPGPDTGAPQVTPLRG